MTDRDNDPFYDDDITIPDGAYGVTVLIWMRQKNEASGPAGWTWHCGVGRGIYDGIQWYDNLYFRHFGEGYAGPDAASIPEGWEEIKPVNP